MRVWVDLTNSPHALFFAPVARRLIARGDEVLVTARRFAQTVELAEELFDDPVPVGAGSRSSLSQKVYSLGDRVRALAPVVRAFAPDVAVAHGSYDQPILARMLGIPALAMVDYEYHPGTHLLFRLATRLLLPEAFSTDLVLAHGGRGKTWRYHGLKEEVYLTDFVPDPAAAGRARHRRARRSGHHPAATRRRRDVPPAREPAVDHHRAAPAGRARRADPGAAAAPLAGAGVARVGRSAQRPGAGPAGGRPGPDLVVGCRGVGRRHDEPGGRRARHTGVVGVLRATRFGGRCARRRRPDGSAHLGRRPGGPADHSQAGAAATEVHQRRPWTGGVGHRAHRATGTTPAFHGRRAAQRDRRCCPSRYVLVGRCTGAGAGRRDGIHRPDRRHSGDAPRQPARRGRRPGRCHHDRRRGGRTCRGASFRDLARPAGPPGAGGVRAGRDGAVHPDGRDPRRLGALRGGGADALGADRSRGRAGLPAAAHHETTAG